MTDCCARPFATLANRTDLRMMIQAQALGRFNNDMLDDPIPHILWKLLDDMDAVDAELKTARADLTRLHGVAKGLVDAGGHAVDCEKTDAHWHDCTCVYDALEKVVDDLAAEGKV